MRQEQSLHGGSFCRVPRGCQENQAEKQRFVQEMMPQAQPPGACHPQETNNEFVWGVFRSKVAPAVEAPFRSHLAKEHPGLSRPDRLFPAAIKNK